MANMVALKIHKTPLSIIVLGVPIIGAREPAKRLPNGLIPAPAMTNKLMILPRLSSSTIVCRKVLLTANCEVFPKPVSSKINIEIQKT